MLRVPTIVCTSYCQAVCCKSARSQTVGDADHLAPAQTFPKSPIATELLFSSLQFGSVGAALLSPGDPTSSETIEPKFSGATGADPSSSALRGQLNNPKRRLDNSPMSGVPVRRVLAEPSRARPP